MSDVDILAKLVEDNPDNSIVASMLQDELMGERDYQPTEAARHVTRIQERGRTNRDLATATRLMSAESPYREELTTLITVVSRAPAFASGMLIIIHGDIEPYYHHRTGELYPQERGGWAVTVGASWIVAQHGEMDSRPWPARSRRRRSRKPTE